MFLSKFLKNISKTRQFYSTCIIFGSSLAAGSFIYNFNPHIPYILPRNKCILAKAASSNKNFVSDVVEEVTPAVVTINTWSLSAQAGGSGFIIDKSGLIITNSHVVGRQNKVIVMMSDGKSRVGKVIAVDRVCDLALISIETNGVELKSLTLEDPDNIRTGDFAVAIGSPLFLTNSVTFGVVSSKDRDLKLDGGIKYIQTDASITFGNSGGPLVNMDGRVIGVNTMMAVVGIGFAIPSSYVKNFVKLATKEQSNWKSSRSPPQIPAGTTRYSGTRYLGVIWGSLTSQLLQEFLTLHPSWASQIGSAGVLVHNVFPNSPASKKLEAGDIIKSVNGVPVNNIKDIYDYMSKHDGAISFELFRNGKMIKVDDIIPEYH